MESIANDNHNYVYNTYKELNKILPHNFLKIKVMAGKKYHFSNKELINSIENNYNLNKYIDKNGTPKKCIYLYSSSRTDKPNEKLISKNILSQKTLKNKKNKNKTEIKRTNVFLRTKGFNSSPIKNYFLRNNICLPEITHRIKYKIPRNERELNGFKIIGNNIKTLYNNTKDFKININNNSVNKTNKNRIICKKINKKKIVSKGSMTEENMKNKKFSFDKSQNNDTDTLNIISILSIYNKNKNTKLNFYDKTEEKNNSLN